MNENFTEWLHGWVGAINDPMWSYLVYMLLGTGLFFTVTTGFVQFRLFGRSIKEMLGGRKQGDDPHGITPFQAFVTGLASRVGVGNIAGVAIAIKVGGPGAVFWMWVTALIGMSRRLSNLRWRSSLKSATTTTTISGAALPTTSRKGWGRNGWACCSP